MLRWSVVFKTIAYLACAPTWLALGARWWWPLDLATCFVWWYAAALPLFLSGALLLRRWLLSLLIAVSLAINAANLAPYILPMSAAAVEDSPRLRVMTLNVLTANRAYDKVLRLVEQQDPDVLVLVEVDRRWIDAMAPLRVRYPHHSERTRSDNFGVAIYSRLPSEDVTVRQLNPGATPSAVARVRWEGLSVTVIGAHPVPPMSAAGAASRNNDLDSIERFAAGTDGGVVVVGDLNITPWSPYFQDLLHGANLRDSAWGRGVRATWGTDRTGLVIPIDHMLHTPDLVVVDRRIGPDVGSDHRAVTVDFARAAD